jgi:membrane-associated protein
VFDVAEIIRTGGLLLIALIIFAESGLMVGFFLPGDTLLFSAGIFAAQGTLPLGWTIAVIAGAAIAGDNLGYQIGRTMGRRLFRKKDGFIFRKDYIMKAERFYEVYGTKMMLVAHFVPIVRAFAPLIAGVAKMPRAQFVLFGTIGVIAWSASITLAGYWLGSRIPGIEHYLEPVLLGVIIAALAPTLYHLLKDPKVQAILKVRFRRKTKQAPAEDQ